MENAKAGDSNSYNNGNYCSAARITLRGFSVRRNYRHNRILLRSATRPSLALTLNPGEWAKIHKAKRRTRGMVGGKRQDEMCSWERQGGFFMRTAVDHVGHWD